jgi:AcrR family transcriptional regulator
MDDPKEERRREILMAALKAFSEKGYDKTTVEDIVRISGRSKGTLYWYFTNKEAIFAGLVQMVFDMMWLAFENALQQTVHEPPPERLRHLLLSLVPIIDESSNWIGLYADFFNQAWQKPTVRDNFGAFYTRYLHAVEPIVQQGIDEGAFRDVDPRQTARMLVGALDGYWFQQILELGDASPVIMLYAETIVKGLLKDHASDS